MRSVKIVSDGLAQTTRVFDTESGAEIKGATACQFSVRATGDGIVSKAEVEFLAVHADVAASCVFMVTNPITGRPQPVRRIEFCDGTIFEAE